MARGASNGLLAGVVLVLGAAGCGSARAYGSVHLGELVVEGTVDGDFLARQLIQLDPPFEACYARALRHDRTLEGVVQFALRGGSGRLAGAITTNVTGSSELGECVLGAISGLSIIEPEHSAPWDYTADWSAKFEIARPDRRPN